MILEYILNPVFSLINSLIETLPSSFFEIPDWFISFRSILCKGISLLPDGLFGIVIGNVVFWIATQYGWAVIEWIYKKIPGVD